MLIRTPSLRSIAWGWAVATALLFAPGLAEARDAVRPDAVLERLASEERDVERARLANELVASIKALDADAPVSASLVDDLSALLADPSMAVRLSAAEAIGSLGPRAARAEGALREAARLSRRPPHFDDDRRADGRMGAPADRSLSGRLHRLAARPTAARPDAAPCPEWPPGRTWRAGAADEPVRFEDPGRRRGSGSRRPC